MKYFSALMVFLLLSCDTKELPIDQQSDYTLINKHKGGVVWQEAYALSQYQKPIKIKGLCASSCTLAFEYSSTCLYPKARIMFHAPREPSGAISYGTYGLMLEAYPPKIANWFKATLSGSDYWFNAREMHKKFDIKMCPNNE